MTQERLAEYMNVSVATIHNWERGRRSIRAQDRIQLLTLLGVLHIWGGLKTEDEANELLRAGGYSRLDETEASEYLPAQLPEDEIEDKPEDKDGNEDNQRKKSEENHDEDDKEQQKEIQKMSTPSNPSQTLTNPTLTSILQGPDWPEDESRLAAIVLHLLGYPFDQFDAGKRLRLSAVVTIWIFSSAIWTQALTWPFLNQSDTVQAWILWGGMAVAAPGLLGLIVKADRQDILIATTRSKRSIGLIRTTGALAGYLIGSVIVLLLVLGLFFLGLWPPSRWLVAGFAGLPLLIGYAAAKRMPLNHFRAFSPKRGEENAFRLEEGDWVMLFAFCGLGPAMAAIFAVGQPWTWPPLVGAGILGAAFMGVAALQILAHRMGEKLVPAWIWALLLGVPLGLQMIIQPGTEPLLGIGLIGGLAVLALDLRRQKETPSLVPMLGFLGVLILVGVLLKLNIWVGRVGSLIGVGVVWRWFGDMFRWMAGFWLVAALLVACLLLIATTGIPSWVVKGGFAVGVVWVGVWRGWGLAQLTHRVSTDDDQA